MLCVEGWKQISLCSYVTATNLQACYMIWTNLHSFSNKGWILADLHPRPQTLSEKEGSIATFL